jgi:hypothetical protein
MPDQTLAMFTASLASLLQEDVLPWETIGDLDDLLFTSEKLCALLRSIAQEGGDGTAEQLASRLFEVQIMIEQDLPMIVNDLLPPLRRLSGETLEHPPGNGEPT